VGTIGATDKSNPINAHGSQAFSVHTSRFSKRPYRIYTLQEILLGNENQWQLSRTRYINTPCNLGSWSRYRNPLTDVLSLVQSDSQALTKLHRIALTHRTHYEILHKTHSNTHHILYSYNKLSQWYLFKLSLVDCLCPCSGWPVTRVASPHVACGELELHIRLPLSLSCSHILTMTSSSGQSPACSL
jgi:hypothetical protein